MTPDLDIYRSAQVLIREHGDEAVIAAAKHADAMLAKGDLEGFAVWKRIVRAVEEIERKGRREMVALWSRPTELFSALSLCATRTK